MLQTEFDTLVACVRAGAEWLDNEVPDWRDKLPEPDDIDMSDPFMCIAGWVFKDDVQDYKGGTGYGVMLQKLHTDHEIPNSDKDQELGFDAWPDFHATNQEQYSVLTELWMLAKDNRLEEAIHGSSN